MHLLGYGLFSSKENILKKILIKQTMPGVWTITLMTATGPTVNRTPYATADQAIKVAEAQHPNVEIEVKE
jgi:hypothetical protein